MKVALRKESVDRNLAPLTMWSTTTTSLSARRAWIEMDVTAKTGLFTSVALRKESVDRNDVIRPAIDVFLASLSARRAWIEIQFPFYGLGREVSLSARRAWIEIPRPSIAGYFFHGRSPQGERG